MKSRYLVIAVCFTLNLVPAAAMEWPFADGVTSGNFGFNDEGQPLLGMAFSTESQVLAADKGELLFYNEEDSGASGLPSPLGSWLAVDHGDGIIGMYSRMNRERPMPPDLVEGGTVLGQSGRSGWSSGQGLYFSLFDRKERRWINPVMIVTPLPQPGVPTVISVKLRGGSGQLVDLSQTRTVSQGQYTVLVEALEVFRGSRPPLAPSRIVCSINGAETGGLSFETFSGRDGMLMAYRNSLVPARQIYSPYPAFELGTATLSRGQVTLDIIVHNPGGTARNAVYRLNVE